jgi:hypothetical protein
MVVIIFADPTDESINKGGMRRTARSISSRFTLITSQCASETRRYYWIIYSSILAWTVVRAIPWFWNLTMCAGLKQKIYLA